MPQNIDKARYQWTPGRSVGRIRLGAPFPEAFDDFQLSEVVDDIYDDPTHKELESVADGVRVYLHYGKVAYVRCWKEFYYGTDNLIGMTAEAVKDLLPDACEKPLVISDSEKAFACEPLGIVFWETDGAVDTVSVREPYIWEWEPWVRLGEIRFGEPLPQTTSLEFREDEEGSYDVEIQYDVVTHGVSVGVDRDTGRVKSMHTTGTVKFQGEDLIQRPIDAVKARLGGEWSDGGIEGSRQYENYDLGIILWDSDGDPTRVFGVLVYGDDPDDEADP